MTKANAGSLLVFDASKIDLSSATDVTPSGDAVEGIVTERGQSMLSKRFIHLSHCIRSSRSSGNCNVVALACMQAVG